MDHTEWRQRLNNEPFDLFDIIKVDIVRAFKSGELIWEERVVRMGMESKELFLGS